MMCRQNWIAVLVVTGVSWMSGMKNTGPLADLFGAKEDKSVAAATNIPLLDLQAPKVVETATFALG